MASALHRYVNGDFCSPRELQIIHSCGDCEIRAGPSALSALPGKHYKQKSHNNGGGDAYDGGGTYDDKLTNALAYGTRRFNVAFTRALQ